MRFYYGVTKKYYEHSEPPDMGLVVLPDCSPLLSIQMVITIRCHSFPQSKCELVFRLELDFWPLMSMQNVRSPYSKSTQNPRSRGLFRNTDLLTMFSESATVHLNCCQPARWMCIISTEKCVSKMCSLYGSLTKMGLSPCMSHEGNKIFSGTTPTNQQTRVSLQTHYSHWSWS